MRFSFQQTVLWQLDGAVAQWIRLRPPSGSPRFETQAHHLRFFYLESNLLYLSLRWEGNENKQKETRFGPYFKTVLWLFVKWPKNKGFIFSHLDYN